MNDENINNFISLDNTLLCHSGAVFSSFTLYFQYKLNSLCKISIPDKEKLGGVLNSSGIDEIEPGEGKHEFQVNFKNLTDTLSFSLNVEYTENKQVVKKSFEVKINKCNIKKHGDLLYQTSKKEEIEKDNLEKSELQSNDDATPTPSETMFVYNPIETPTPTPLNIELSSSTKHTFGNWFNFDEVTAQIPFDVGANSSIPIIFKNASFDFSNFPSLEYIDHTEDRIDLLLYITRGEYTRSTPWNLYHDLERETAKAYGVWHENFDYLREYEEFSLKPKKFVFENHVNPLGGLGEAVGKYKLGEAFEPEIPKTVVCMSGFLGYVNWEEWKQSGKPIMLHAYLVSNFDQFYWPIGTGSDVMDYYSVPLDFYYLSGSTPTPIVDKTPTPVRTPSPIPTPTPYPTPSEEMGFHQEETPTPTQTPIGIENLDFTEDLRLMLEVAEIEDGPSNRNTIHYSSDIDQKYTTNVSCGDVLTGQMSNDKNNLVHIRVLISDGKSLETWTETTGEPQSDIKSKVSVSAPWNQIYLKRNENCETDYLNMNLSEAKLHDIQLKSVGNNQLYYPHQTLKFNLWKLDMDNNKKDKLGEVKFNSVNSDVNGWWSPGNASWERHTILNTNTPTPTPTATPTQSDGGSFEFGEDTPTPISLGDLKSWFTYETATINVNYDDFHSVVIKNVNVTHTNKPSSLEREQDYTLVVWSIVKEVLITRCVKHTFVTTRMDVMD